jgi:hypothetical protein
VVTAYPLETILCSPNVTGNFVKFDLEFSPCHSIKSQALAHFVVEWIPSAVPHKDSKRFELTSATVPCTLMAQPAPKVVVPELSSSPQTEIKSSTLFVC